MAEVIDYPDDPLGTFPTIDPYIRRAKFGGAGLITYLINDGAGVEIHIRQGETGSFRLSRLQLLRFSARRSRLLHVEPACRSILHSATILAAIADIAGVHTSALIELLRHYRGEHGRYFPGGDHRGCSVRS
jgi:hypothetical protein